MIMKKILLYLSCFLFSGAMSAQVVCGGGGSTPCAGSPPPGIDVCTYTQSCPAGFAAIPGSLLFLCSTGALLSNNPPSCVAPIEMTYFRAGVTDGNVVLEWETATETNNQEFEIFRSFDGAYYESIGQLDGAGSSVEAKSYQFVDAGLVDIARSNEVYYYVKQVDFDGEFTVSDVASVELEVTATFEMRNVVAGQETGIVSVFFQTLNGGNVVATVYDISGRALATQSVEVEEGFASMDIEVGTKSGGIYVVSLTDGKEVVSTKFVK